MSKKLPILPENPDRSSFSAVDRGRFPKWLHRKMPQGGSLWETQEILNSKRRITVCEEAKCPNLLECWSRKTATFLAMGKTCTRNCGFCAIDFSSSPKPLEENEPELIAESIRELGLKHAVITMVARDDLEDGGANHLVRIISAIRHHNLGTTVEILTSDLGGNLQALQTVLAASPEIFNHNIETVRRLTPRVRHRATYDRTLEILHFASTYSKKIWVKSGLMLGLGEEETEVRETLFDLHHAGCRIVTLGQYLQPSRNKLLVKSFISPEQFESFASDGRKMGIPFVYAGPFIRSSYNADKVFETLLL